MRSNVEDKLRGVNLKRATNKEEEAQKGQEIVAPAVSAGPLEKVLDFTYNSSIEKEREVTVISPLQGRLLPILDVVDAVWQNIVEISTYRQDPDMYKTLYDQERPIPLNLIGEYRHRLIQYAKSVNGANLKSLNDLALAEMETKAREDDDPYGGKGVWDD